MKLSDLRVGTLEYLVTREAITGVWSAPGSDTNSFRVGATADLIPHIDLLRDELRNPAAVSSGRVPHLKKFMVAWGRAFLPATLAEAGLDVLVIVPHAALHDLPLHLISYGPQDLPLGAQLGVSYASSRSLFVRCASRNPARLHPSPDWTFDVPEGPRNHPSPQRIWSVAADVLAGQDRAFWDLCRDLSTFVTAAGGTASLDERMYSRPALKAAFRQGDTPDILCVMAHGYVDPRNHQFSGLFLKPDWAGGITSRVIGLHGGRYFEFRDLPLRRLPGDVHTVATPELLTIAEMEIDTQSTVPLVVLLACSAGWGRVLQGDEPASLAETFLHTGAASVIAALWDSDIDAVRAWMQHFFTGYVTMGKPKALAARYALAQMAQGAWADRPELYGVITLRGDWL